MKLNITTPMTYPEIAAGLGIRDRNRLAEEPFSLAIELCKRVIAGKLKYRNRNFLTRWPLYGPGKRDNPLRSKP